MPPVVVNLMIAPKSHLIGLKMLVIPLVVFSIIAGVSRLERNVTGKIGGYALAYYTVTTFSAVILGIILCAGIKVRGISFSCLIALEISLMKL